MSQRVMIPSGSGAGVWHEAPAFHRVRVEAGGVVSFVSDDARARWRRGREKLSGCEVAVVPENEANDVNGGGK